MTNILHVFCKKSKLSGAGVKSALQKGPALSKICLKQCHLLLFKEFMGAGDADMIFQKQIAKQKIQKTAGELELQQNRCSWL